MANLIEKSLKILMLEDSQDDIHLIEHTLRKNNMPFTARHVDTRQDFLNTIRSFQPDVILSDHGLPQFNSREALKISQRECAQAPFIIVTGTMTDEFAISCLREGADDYLLKSNLSRLPMAITRAVKERRLEQLKRNARHALRKQNEELLKVNSELDHFVYSVSHNLRGPVASVLGLISISKLEDDPEKIRPVIAMMEKSMNNLDVTLHEIVDFLRNARAEVELTEIDWKTKFANAINSLSRFGYNDEVQVNYTLETDVPFITDGRRLRAVLVNILSNALIFRSPKRNLVIGISVSTAEGHAAIEITDNGKGIRATVLPRVFEMFYRGSEDSQGAGLGLYITHEIVKKLGGYITISSIENQGTTVTIKLPSQTMCVMPLEEVNSLLVVSDVARHIRE